MNINSQETIPEKKIFRKLCRRGTLLPLSTPHTEKETKMPPKIKVMLEKPVLEH